MRLWAELRRMKAGAHLFQKEMVLPTHGGPPLGLLALSLHLPPTPILEKSGAPSSGEDLRWARRRTMRV